MKYSEIMRSLVSDTNNKNHEAVVGRITEPNKDLLHAALGLASELPELVIALTGIDEVNLKEEIGDILWYTTLAKMQLNSNISKNTNKVCSLYDNLQMSIGEIVDLIKKKIFYGKEVSDDKIMQQLVNVEESLSCLCEINGITIHSCAMAVDHKLRLRYSGGYTDNKAINRDVSKEHEVMSGKKE
jgi:NTP pyrophosphatase (non-canonical NTP hydrolase)